MQKKRKRATMEAMYRLFALLFFFSFLAAEDLLIFHHLPKCGGTTIASLLGEKFHQDAIFHCAEPPGNYFAFFLTHEKFLDLTECNFEKIQYIHGHFSYRDDSRLKNSRRITFLRDPLHRVLSTYRYVNQSYPKEFSQLYPSTANLQVKLLSSLSRFDPSISLKEHLESAKKNLAENFFFVGIVEELQPSLDALYTLMGWEKLKEIPLFNQTLKTKTPPEWIALIDKEEWADRELYAFAKKLFEEKWASITTKTPEHRPLQFIDSVDFNAKDPLDGEGWGYREWDTQTNTLLRQSWTEKAFLRFPLLRKDYHFSCNLFFVSRKNAKNFQLFVNGHKLNLKKIKDSRCQIETTIPKEWIEENALTTFTFATSPLFVPSIHTQDTKDHRTLGVGLSAISIKSMEIE